MDPHDKLQNEVSERLGEADRSIPRTPPKSLEGIAIVLRFVRERLALGDEVLDRDEGVASGRRASGDRSVG